VSGALRALLHGVVDYAGLFPPAALDMRRAAREYDRSRTSSDAWMLGRFVVPVAGLDALEFELSALHPAGPSSWPVAALAGADVASDVRRIRPFNDGGFGATVDTIETRVATADDILSVAAHAARDFSVFVELPVRDDPATLVDAAKRAGVHAKIRTGGVTADAFPSPHEIVRFMRRCIDAGVLFKATAGLHHPVRASYRLTYADDAPRGEMYGYLNVFLAAAMIAGGAGDDDAKRVLEERDASAFEIGPDAITWRVVRLDASALAVARRRVISSFGSCSFREPVDDLRAMGLLA